MHTEIDSFQDPYQHVMYATQGDNVPTQQQYASYDVDLLQ